MNASWFIFIFLVLMLCEIKYYNFVALKNISYTRYFSRRAVFEDENVQIIEVIENNKFTPVPYLRVESRISRHLRFNSQENLNISMEKLHRSAFFLKPFRRVTRSHDVLCAHRGRFALRQNSVTAGDLFGIVAKTKDFPVNDDIVVYPRVLSEQELPDTAVAFQGDISSRRWILPDPVLVNGIRDYQNGDNQRDIHWSATARSGELMVKVRDFTVSPKAFVILNSQVSENLWSVMSEEEKEIIEEGIRISAGIISLSLENGLPAGFASNCTLEGREGETVYIPPVASDSQLETILETMASILVVCQLSFQTFLSGLVADSVTGLDIAIVSAYTNDDIEYMMNLLRGMGNTVSLVMIPCDIGEVSA